MRIIKAGILPENRVYTSTCRNCKTEFEFFAHEGEFVSDQRVGDFVRINCPLCRYNVCVNIKGTK